MKNIIKFMIILSIFFVNVVFAESILDIDKSIIEFPEIENYNLQGFTTTDKYLFMVLVGFDDTKSIIKVFDLEDYKLIKEYNFESLGHANDVTYNSKEDQIYVLDSGGSNVMHRFSNKTFEYIDSFTISLPGRSISYIDQCDCYAIRTIATGFLLDHDFNLNSKIPFIIGMNIKKDLGRQGWAYYNEHIYYSNWSWIRLGGDGFNIVYVYDMHGTKKDSLYIKNDIGEIEGISFYEDKMILGFNGYDGKIKFYLSDIPDIPTEVVEDVNDEETVIENNNEEYSDTKYYFITFGIVLFIFIIFIYYISLKSKKIL